MMNTKLARAALLAGLMTAGLTGCKGGLFGGGGPALSWMAFDGRIVVGIRQKLDGYLYDDYLIIIMYYVSLDH